VVTLGTLITTLSQLALTALQAVQHFKLLVLAVHDFT